MTNPKFPDICSLFLCSMIPPRSFFPEVSQSCQYGTLLADSGYVKVEGRDVG